LKKVKVLYTSDQTVKINNKEIFFIFFIFINNGASNLQTFEIFLYLVKQLSSIAVSERENNRSSVIYYFFFYNNKSTFTFVNFEAF
jgi:hypothetical protein